MQKIVAGLVFLACILLFLAAPLYDTFQNQVAVYPVERGRDGRLMPLNKSV
jgi:hypothetical protein